jgi:hypothetical protein
LDREARDAVIAQILCAYVFGTTKFLGNYRRKTEDRDLPSQVLAALPARRRRLPNVQRRLMKVPFCNSLTAF